MHSLLSEIAAKYSLKRRSGKWAGQCPECGGGKSSDKFNLHDSGGFKCYSCDFKGDIITWLRDREGMTCPQAHEAAGKSCTNTGCAVWTTCRMGDGTGKRQYRPRSITPQKQKQKELPTTTVTNPGEKWQVWAQTLLKTAQQQLSTRQDDLAWLSGRGIGPEAVRRFGLGWLPKNSKVNREAIGLGPRDDGKPHLWIPDGLLIPIFDNCGKIHRLRVRRPQQSRDRFLPDLKYVWLEGAGTGPMVIRPGGNQPRGGVIVEAELDGMAVAAAHNQVLVVALGTVRAGLPDDLRREFAELPVILVSLDADPGKNGKKGAGPQAIAAWSQEYRQAKFWPVPHGKDPGNYAELGGNLKAWIEAGLPPETPTATPAYDSIPLPVCNTTGGRGKEDEGLEDAALTRMITLKNGRTFYVVTDQPSWEALVADGKIVFSENELKRLQLATSGMSEADRLDAANKVLDTKEIFGAAYISRGEVIS